MVVSYDLDARGYPIARVPLLNSERSALLDRSDYDRVQSLLPAASWFVNNNEKGQLYVRVKCPRRGNNETVARLVAGLMPGTGEVKVIDGDAFNLRRENLQIRRWRAPSKPLSQRLDEVAKRASHG